MCVCGKFCTKLCVPDSVVKFPQASWLRIVGEIKPTDGLSAYTWFIAELVKGGGMLSEAVTSGCDKEGRSCHSLRWQRCAVWGRRQPWQPHWALSALPQPMAVFTPIPSHARCPRLCGFNWRRGLGRCALSHGSVPLDGTVSLQLSTEPRGRRPATSPTSASED